MIEIQTGNSLNFLTDIGPFKNKELKYPTSNYIRSSQEPRLL